MANILSSIVVSVILCGLAVSQNDVSKILPDTKELVLREGATQELNCSVTSNDQEAKLVWTYPTEDGIKKWTTTSSSRDNITIYSMLKIGKFELAHAGEYKCTLNSNNISVEKVILLTAVKENKTHAVFSENMPTASLSCSFSFETNRSITEVKWYKTIYKDKAFVDELVSNLKESSRFNQVDENNSLIITKPTLDDAGVYIARFKFPEPLKSYDCEVEFQAGPSVQKFDKTKNLIEGDKMDLKCEVKGQPRSAVRWYKNNQPLNDSRYVVEEILGDHQTVHLYIPSLEFADEGDYMCLAYSALFNESSNKTVTVRVKDKLAALWPFLGIVGEVVVLCTIIFIYEKRRNNQVELQEKAAEVDGPATEKKEGLRHRTANNPTA